MPSDVHVVLTTAPDSATAEGLAERLIEERVAACANIVPGVRSIYRWEGALQKEGEVMLFLKTAAARVDDLKDRLVELHPYDVPEVLALPVVAGLPAYMEWVYGEVEAGPTG